MIERNTGDGFVSIGTVPARFITNTKSYYNFSDASINWQSASIINYRLKIIDKDGAFSYSAIVSISVNDRSSIVSVFPNPVSNG
ncbi:MAG: hypothetical protein IPL04_09100 [Chitinophagaceae bacterium]|nr:hypothetical protein [Chitinophagaceae bacterium]